MTESALSGKRAQSLGEEIANSVSHGVGLAAAAAATPFLIVEAIRRGGAPGVIGASIFASTVGLLYLTSVLYHALPQSRASPRSSWGSRRRPTSLLPPIDESGTPTRPASIYSI